MTQFYASKCSISGAEFHTEIPQNPVKSQKIRKISQIAFLAQNRTFALEN